MLPFGHVMYKYIPKWNRQPKANEATCEVCLKSPHWHNKLE